MPHFSLQDQQGKTHTSDEYKGKWLVVYFYPADDTPGCTKEACSFRDNYSILQEKGIEIVGISKDTVESHKNFVQKYQLPFTLLADPTLETIKAFGVLENPKLLGLIPAEASRFTFLIDPHGVIQKIYEKVTPADHAKEILEDWEALQSAR